MSKDNKLMKSRRQRGDDLHSIVSKEKRKTVVSKNKYGNKSNSPPKEDWSRVCERVENTKRMGRVKVTLPPTPWDEEK